MTVHGNETALVTKPIKITDYSGEGDGDEYQFPMNISIDIETPYGRPADRIQPRRGECLLCGRAPH